MESCLCVSSKVALLCLYVDIYVRIFHFYFTELHTTFFITSRCRCILMCVDMQCVYKRLRLRAVSGADWCQQPVCRCAGWWPPTATADTRAVIITLFSSPYFLRITYLPSAIISIRLSRSTQ